MDTINPQAVSPGHGNEGDDLADTVSPHTYVEDNPQSDVNEQAMQEMSI